MDVVKERASEAEISRARQLYEYDDVEIDDDALISRHDDGEDRGYWVSAWVWVGQEGDQQ